MSLRINYHELARTDLYDAWSCYEAREYGLSDRFIAAVDAALDQVAEWPTCGSPTIVVDGDVTERRVGTTGFPYLARYRIINNMVLVRPSITRDDTPASAPTAHLSREPEPGRQQAPSSARDAGMSSTTENVTAAYRVRLGVAVRS